jgi:hypothetical protein
MNQQPNEAASARNAAERRGRQRTHLQLKANLASPGDLTIVGHTLDMSSSGLILDVPYELEAGQRCAIELYLSKPAARSGYR